MNKISEEEVINKLQKYNVIKKITKCSTCNSDVKLVTRTRAKGGNLLKSFRCINSKCQKYHSLTENSFFSLFRKPFMLIVEIIKMWCIQLSIAKAIDYLEIDENSTNIF